MSFDPSDYDEGPGDEWVHVDELLDRAIEDHGAELEAHFTEILGQAWLSESKSCIDLLSAVSQKDPAHLQSAMKQRLVKNETDSEQLTEKQRFEIASDVCDVLERVADSVPAYQLAEDGEGPHNISRRPAIGRSLLAAARLCTITEDLSWVNELLLLSRAFRDLLFALSDCELRASGAINRVSAPINVLNEFLGQTRELPLVFWRDNDAVPKFGQRLDPKVPNLAYFVAWWISDYLQNHYPQVRLGVCVECGRFFERGRRDKTFCSKTCQNRVAYKRKKILDSDAFTQVSISPDNACDIAVGLWMHHPRFGIGLIESASSNSLPMRIQLEDESDDREHRILYKSMLSRHVEVHVRFLQGTRALGYSDLFDGPKKEDQLPTFYRVKSKETLEQLL